MSYDRNWRVRKQFADFMSIFLKPLEEYRPRNESKELNNLSEAQLKSKFPVSLHAKKTRKAFKTILADITLEILNDADD